MRKILALALAIAVLTGCPSIPKSHLEFDQKVYAEFGVEHMKYVDADPNLTQEQKDRRRRSLEVWKMVIEKGGE